MSPEYEGKLIALEGPDGCGKSTQAKLLTDWLESEGFDVELTREPTDSPIGQIIRKSLDGDMDLPVEAEALLFAADRVLHISDVIRPSLKEGKVVVTGRYVYSSLAYQAARGLPKEWIEDINEPAVPPDLAIIINIPPEIGLERVNYSGDSDKFERDLELQKKVREAYIKLAEERGVPLIDGTQSKKKVQSDIREEVSKILHADLGREG